MRDFKSNEDTDLMKNYSHGYIKDYVCVATEV